MGCPPALAVGHVYNHVEVFLYGDGTPTPRTSLDAPCVASHGLWLCALVPGTLGMAVLVQGLPLAQRTWAGWGMAAGICSGSIAEGSCTSLRKRARAIARDYSSGEDEADFAQSKFSRWFLSNPSPCCNYLVES